MNTNEKITLTDEELILAPKKELKVIKNATGTKKYPMILEYSEPVNKKDVIQKLAELKCPILSTLDFANCVVTSLTKSEIEEIKKCNFISSVERNYEYDLLESSDEREHKVHSENHSITLNSLEVLKTRNKNGGNIKIAIFDTGVAKHPDLNIAGGACFVGNGNTYTDTDGHGTKIAGIIASSTNREMESDPTEIYAVKIFGDNGHATTASIICAINWAIETHINIINMSFGTYYPSAILKKYIDIAADNGIIIVAAVGNDGGFKDKQRIMYPAKYENVIAVGAGNAYGTSVFSNNSIELDFVAPGSTISTDVNGQYSNITGTSVSCAYITSILASIWSNKRNVSSVKLINAVKNSGKVLNAADSYVGFGEIDVESALTNIGAYDNIEANKFTLYSADVLSSVTDTSYPTAAVSNATYSLYSDCGSGGCDDFMPSAIPLNLSESKEISYSDLEQGIWYKFTADEIDAHPGIGTGFYHIYTFGMSSTIGVLYDSSGTLIAYSDDDNINSWRGFEIYAELEYSMTYYIYVAEKELKGGKVSILVEPVTDDHGNSMSSATYLGDVYSQNFSVSGFLHNAIDQNYNGDLDYFYFLSSKECVVEIFSENSSDVYGAIYDENGIAVIPDSYEIENDDFKLTCHIERDKYYYIEVSKLSNFDYATNYTLNVKFLKDYSNNIIDEQYRVMYWYARNQDEYPGMGHSITRYMVFVSNTAKTEFEIRVLEDRFKQREPLEEVLNIGTAKEILDVLCNRIISSIPVVGDALSYAYDIGSIIYGFMTSESMTLYQEKTIEIENKNQYIIGKNSWFTDYPGGLSTGNYTTYTVGSGTYYGADYQKGIFVETCLKHEIVKDEVYEK